MAIEIKIPKEVMTFKSKPFFGFTLRQLVCLALAGVICVPLYIWGNKVMDEDIVAMLIMVIAAPLLLAGFFTYNGMPFERFGIVLFRFYLEPQKRPYEYLGKFHYIRAEMLKDNLEIQRKVKSKQLKEISSLQQYLKLHKFKYKKSDKKQNMHRYLTFVEYLNLFKTRLDTDREILIDKYGTICAIDFIEHLNKGDYDNLEGGIPDGTDA